MDYNFYSRSNYSEIKKCIQDEKMIWIYRYMPIIKFIEYNNVLNFTHFINSFSESSVLSESKGSSLVFEDIAFKPPTKINSTLTKINKTDVDYLEKIVEFCHQNNIKIVLYTAPIYQYNKYFETSYPDFEEKLGILLENYSIPYLNYKNLYSFKTDHFKDLIHLNNYGTNKLSLSIANSGYID